MRDNRLVLSATILFSFQCLLPALQAQENGTINGTTADSSGALVPNATVKLTNLRPETFDQPPQILSASSALQRSALAATT